MKHHRATRSVFIIAFLLFALSAFGQQIIIQQPSHGQQVQRPPTRQRTEDQIIAERARRYEQRGDYERALGEWLKVMNIDPWNAAAIDAVPKALMVLRRFDEAESFLADLIGKSEFRGDQPVQATEPTSRFALKLDLGVVKMAREDEEGAWALWNEAVREQNDSPDAVRALVNTLQRARLWEDSERIIRGYRSETKNPTFMARELAGSLQAQMNYAGATEELLLFSETSPTAWQVVNSYMNRFPDDSTVVDRVVAVLQRAIRSDRKNGTLLRIYAAYTLKAGLLEESLNASIEADPLTKSEGRLVLEAAGAMLSEGAVDLARRGYEQVLSSHPGDEALTELAELGLGQCYEALAQYEDAKLAYNTFITNHPQSPEVEQARFRIADILLHQDRNAAEALTMFKGIWIRGRGPEKVIAGLRIGDCHAWMGEFDEAIATWGQVVTLSRNQISEEAADALLRIARANFWRDSTDAAIAVLDSVMNGATVNSAFNDAILYSALLGEGAFHRAVRAFADGDYAMFRDDNGAAAEKFSEAAGMLSSGRMAEWSRFLQALALREADRPADAIAVLDTFITSYPESVDLDRAEYLQAVIRFDDLGDRDGALDALQKFLIEHPRSLYLEQARRKARIISNRVS